MAFNAKMNTQHKIQSDGSRVGLFVTCLVDLLRPQIGFAAARLIQSCQRRVFVPTQSCCGQPVYNAGDEAKAAQLARQNIEIFGSFDYVVVPSGSCAAMIREHYPKLLREDADWYPKARDMAEKTFELSQFLVDVMKVEPVAKTTDMEATHDWRDTKVTYHDSCSGLRELGIRNQPRTLLRKKAGISLDEMTNSEICCGFGGTFCVKFPEVSTAMVDDKIAGIHQTGAELLLGGDLGCLMNIAGRLKRTGSRVRVLHYAELLAGDDVIPAGAGPDQPIAGE